MVNQRLAGSLCMALAASAACGDNSGGSGSSSTGVAGTTGSADTGAAPTGTTGTTTGAVMSSTDTPTGSASESMTGTGEPGSGTGEPTGPGELTGTSTGGANLPPTWESEPGTEIILQDIYVSSFEPNQIFLASSRTDAIRVYDRNSLALLQSFTHPAFSEVANDLFTYGPNGTAFNERGNLVVAAYTQFVEFSDYGVEYETYPKVADEANENIIFDARGNLYTTTATGGTDKLNKYRASDYAFEMTVALPQGAGQFTGITFDGYGRLYVASQSDNKIHMSDFNTDFVDFGWVKTLTGVGNVKGFEGIQFNANNELIAAAGDIVRYDVNGGVKLGTFDAPTDQFPVPLRVDNEGNIYTADYENGNGSISADIFKFSPDGQLLGMTNDAGLLGPFGLAISGTVLVGDPPVAWSYALSATDPDGDPLSYAIVDAPPDMTLDANTSTLAWLVTSEDIGEHPVTLEVSDGHGGTATQMFTLTVTAG